MPIYDCGCPSCEECERAFGPDRAAAIAAYQQRAERFTAIAVQQAPRMLAIVGGEL